LKEFWSEITDIETAKIRIADEKFEFDEELKAINFNNKVVLDFGCGIGRNLKYLVTTNAKEIIGFDLPNMIELSKNFLNEEELRQVIFISPPLDLPEKIDIIIAIVVFQHIDNIRELEEFLFKLKSFLKDDGILYINSRGYIDTSFKIDEIEDRNIWHHILKFFDPITFLDAENGTETHQQVFFKIKS